MARTREQWLIAMAKHLENRFERAGYSVPKKIRVSCGLPSTRALGPRTKAIGQCWDKNVSGDRHNEIFISPTIDASEIVGATLAHELVHAVVGVKYGHKKQFKDCAIAIGLEGKMTATTANDDLQCFLDEKIIEIGEYPHSKIDYTKRKKQSTRLIKVVCSNDDCPHMEEEGRPYTVRLSATTLNYGEPICGCCQEYLMEE